MSAKWMKLTRLLKWPLSNCPVHWKTLATLKRRWKSEFALFQSSWRLLQVTNFVKCRWTLLKVEFLRTISKFRKREEISSSLVYFRCKKWKLAFSCRSRAVTAKKCTKKRDARAKLLFWLLNLLLFLTILLPSPSPSSDLKRPSLPLNDGEADTLGY